MIIRSAETRDIPAVRELVRCLSHYFLQDQRSVLPEWFEATLSTESFAQRLTDPAYVNYVAEIDGQLAGYIALKQGFHLYHLFVDPALHRQGLARRLWQHCRQQHDIQQCSVRSSLFAVPVYAQLGFRISDPVGARDGIQFQPMTFSATP